MNSSDNTFKIQEEKSPLEILEVIILFKNKQISSLS